MKDRKRHTENVNRKANQIVVDEMENTRTHTNIHARTKSTRSRIAIIHKTRICILKNKFLRIHTVCVWCIQHGALLLMPLLLQINWNFFFIRTSFHNQCSLLPSFVVVVVTDCMYDFFFLVSVLPAFTPTYFFRRLLFVVFFVSFAHTATNRKAYIEVARVSICSQVRSHSIE